MDFSNIEILPELEPANEPLGKAKQENKDEAQGQIPDGAQGQIPAEPIKGTDSRSRDEKIRSILSAALNRNGRLSERQAAYILEHPECVNVSVNGMPRRTVEEMDAMYMENSW